MLFLNNNELANNIYLTYLKNLNLLEQSARKVASGERLATLADGPGEVGVADLFRQKVVTNNALINGMTTASNFVSTQGEALTDAADIIDDMIDLAADALDTTLTTADRQALDAEFQVLEQEFSSLVNRRFNGLSLFGASLLVRIGIETTDTMTVSVLTIQTITFTGMTLSQLASASAALISLTSRLSSLNRYVGRAGAKSNALTRTINYTQTVGTNLQNSEDAVRDIDLAIETGKFTQQQVILATSQSVLSQSSNLIQSLLQFLS